METPTRPTYNRRLPYWFNVLIACDQLGNALANGSPDNTLSARVGYYASDRHPGKLKPYWKTLERIIDATFAPVQGPQHCFHAWLAEADEPEAQGSYTARVCLSLCLGMGCLSLLPAVRLAVWFNPGWRYRPGVLRYAFWRQARKFAAGRGNARVEP